MIGISLSYKYLLGLDDKLPKPHVLFPKLYAHGVRSIEIRMVPLCADPFEVLQIAQLLWDFGFRITVHSKSKTAENAISEILLPLSKMLLNMRQDELIVTVHPIVGDNVAMLTSLSDCIIQNRYPVRIALENERKLPDKTNGDGLSLTLNAVTLTNRDNVGICFDMGHFAWYADQFTDTPNMLAPKEFLSRVIHTHVHAYSEGTTHFPIDEWREPFSLYIEAISQTYFGVYNLELSPERFSHRCNGEDAFLLSVDTLKRNLPLNAALYSDLKLHYDDRFRHALEILRKQDGTYVSLIGSSSYLFSTHGFHWGMDIAFRNLRFLTQTPLHIREYLGELQLILLTHAHADHMEESTIRALADTEISWVVPHFIVDDMIKYGVRREKLIVVKADDVIRVGPLTVRVLPGRHYRPGGKGIEAVGYEVTADNAPSLVFPGDVRDYDAHGAEKLDADYCFAHIWLSDDASDPEKYLSKCEELAEFMLKMSARNIFLTHLYENGRTENSMWQLHHAHAAADAIRRKSVTTQVCVPKCGEIFELLP